MESAPTRATGPRWWGHFRSALGSSPVGWLAMLAICAAYLQGGLQKAADLHAATAEMQHFGLSPAQPFALATIALELLAPAMILLGYYRWLGALGLGAFTLAATFLANRFWELAGNERFMAANSFFEHLGLVGAFVLIAWHDVHVHRPRSAHQPL